MKFNKRESALLSMLFLAIFVYINLNLIYKPMKEKEKQLINNINTIKVSKKISNENKINKSIKEDTILTIEKYLEQQSMVNYINKEKLENDRISLSIRISGITQSIVDIISNIDKIGLKIYLNNIEITKINAENVECNFKITIFNG